MVQFVVKGPIDVPMRTGQHGAKSIDDDELNELLKSNSDLSKPGCYVFVCKSSAGSLPIYVGKAEKKTIFDESFNFRNKYNLNNYFQKRLRGVLQLYIIHQVSVRNSQGSPVISEVEEFLIGMASRRNSNLINIHGTKPEGWSIAGIKNNGKGKPDNSASEFKKMMGIATKNRPSVIRGTSSTEEISNNELLTDNIDPDSAFNLNEAESVEPNSAEAIEIDEASRLA